MSFSCRKILCVVCNNKISGIFRKQAYKCRGMMVLLYMVCVMCEVFEMCDVCEVCDV